MLAGGGSDHVTGARVAEVGHDGHARAERGEALGVATHDQQPGAAALELGGHERAERAGGADHGDPGAVDLAASGGRCHRVSFVSRRLLLRRRDLGGCSRAATSCG